MTGFLGSFDLEMEVLVRNLLQLRNERRRDLVYICAA